eukprot:CAMPEP_0178389646 /NCGR_PEP_ID=MMETSP0689_2-20121128/10231_1 /TAXON_ID=160604 /ORGANISM="Amphidinium massartii, Strain CS-259" /LENGTH=68 /DNA_ID=CAMNT_0020010117 /DNA_START=83 /DNA_END=289 /DNA_ORIENTATION=-
MASRKSQSTLAVSENSYTTGAAHSASPNDLLLPTLSAPSSDAEVRHHQTQSSAAAPEREGPCNAALQR